MSTETLDKPRTSDGNSTDDGERFHYVKKNTIAQSAVYGTHVVALCGETFPVTKTFKKGAPICDECQRRYEQLRRD